MLVGRMGLGVKARELFGDREEPGRQRGASLEVGLGELALEILGTAGTLMGREAPAVDEGRWAKFALSWPDVVIGGGTPNIQKNIIAERILGLAKD